MEEELTEREKARRKLKSLQSSKNQLIRERNYYKEMYEKVRAENVKLKAMIEDEVNRDWSPVWTKNKLAEAQEENQELKKYIMALEEKRNYKGVKF